MSTIHYIFRDGQAYAIREGKVIATCPDIDALETYVKTALNAEMPMPSGGEGSTGQPCASCGSEIPWESPVCANCGSPNGASLRDNLAGGAAGGQSAAEALHNRLHPPQRMPEEPPIMEEPLDPYPRAASVVTPNGLKGTILGKVASIWGEEVTIRLENGRIVKLPVGTELRQPKTASAPDVIGALEARLAKTTDGTREALCDRSEELNSIKRYASNLIRDGADWESANRLDTIVVTADVEMAEITEAVAHIDAADAYRPRSFSIQAADETPGVSREDASWLDRTMQEMISEAEGRDYARLMDEGPEELSAGMDTSALADPEVTQQIASNFIMDKTAGIDREVADPYITTFLARVEACRVVELANRHTPTVKEAAVEDPYKDYPDDSIFLS